MTRQKLQLICEQGIKLFLMSMLLIVPLVFFTYTHDVFESNKILAFRIFTLMALAAFMTRYLLLNTAERLRPSPLWLPIMAVGISSLLSTLHTNNSLASFFGVYEDFEGIITVYNYLLLWFLVHQTTRNLQDIFHFLVVGVLAGWLASAYGVAQNYGFDFVMWNPTTYSAARLFGSLGNPNFLAAYILMTLPMAVMFFLSDQRRFFKGVMLLAVITMVGAIFFTKSRGAFYGLVAEGICLLAYLIWDFLRRGNLLRANSRWLILLLVLAGLTLFSGQVRSTIALTVGRTLETLNVKQITITPRLYIWRSALQMIRDHPLLGSGLDTFQITFPKYRLAEYWRLEWNGTPEKAHNFFLQIGATTGLVGLFAWLWLIIAFFITLLRQWKSTTPLRRHWSMGIILAQVGFLVQNQFNFTVVAYGSLFWFLLGLGPALIREEEAPQAAGTERFSLRQVPLKTWSLYLLGCGAILLGLMFSLRVWIADVYFKRGIVYLTSGYAQNAIVELSRAVELDPWREIYWVKYGIAYEEAAKGAPDKVPLLQRAAEIHLHTKQMNPLNGYNDNNLGRVYKYWGDVVDAQRLPDAEKACQRATALDPYNVYFALDLASVYLSQRRWDNAEKIVKRLIDLFPDFAIPYSYLGYLALLRGDTGAAYQYLTLASNHNWRGDISTCSSTWSNLGIVRARRGELEAAVQAFHQALELRPQYLEARLNMALILEQLGRNQEAVTEYRTIVNQAPQYPRAEELRRKIEMLERGTLK